LLPIQSPSWCWSNNLHLRSYFMNREQLSGYYDTTLQRDKSVVYWNVRRHVKTLLMMSTTRSNCKIESFCVPPSQNPKESPTTHQSKPDSPQFAIRVRVCRIRHTWRHRLSDKLDSFLQIEGFATSVWYGSWWNCTGGSCEPTTDLGGERFIANRTTASTKTTLLD
jgi:hypothetical protein